MHIFHRDEVIVPDSAEIEDLYDIRMRQSRGDFCFIDEHRDERFVSRHMGENPFDRKGLFKSLHTVFLGEEQLGHPTGGNPPDEDVRPEGDALLVFRRT